MKIPGAVGRCPGVVVVECSHGDAMIARFAFLCNQHGKAILFSGGGMYDRRFVWTWWAGMVPDSFAVGSIFYVARFGVLRIRRVTPIGGGSRRTPPIGVRLARDGPLVHIEIVFPHRDFGSVGGLLIR
jgi:hypothetical protein